MKILITGGLGNLGSWLTEYFIGKGYKVFTFSKNERDVLRDLSFERFYGDITDERTISELFRLNQFDVVIHLASLNEGDLPGYAQKALEINTWGTRNVLQAMINSGQRDTHFIYFSTFHVYGAAKGLIDEEFTVPQPLNDYGATHLFAEYYVKQFHQTFNVPYTIFRLTNSYGCPKELSSSKWYLVLNDLARMAVESKEIRLKSNGKPLRDFIWMGEVSKVADNCINKGPANDTFNLGSGKSVSMLQVAEIVQKAYEDNFHIKLPIHINTEDLNSYDPTLKVSVEKLKHWIGFNATDMMHEEAKKIFSLLAK